VPSRTLATTAAPVVVEITVEAEGGRPELARPVDADPADGHHRRTGQPRQRRVGVRGVAGHLPQRQAGPHHERVVAPSRTISGTGGGTASAARRGLARPSRRAFAPQTSWTSSPSTSTASCVRRCGTRTRRTNRPGRNPSVKLGRLLKVLPPPGKTFRQLPLLSLPPRLSPILILFPTFFHSSHLHQYLDLHAVNEHPQPVLANKILYQQPNKHAPPLLFPRSRSTPSFSHLPSPSHLPRRPPSRTQSASPPSPPRTERLSQTQTASEICTRKKRTFDWTSSPVEGPDADSDSIGNLYNIKPKD
jgi:hypothetical protein